MKILLNYRSRVLQFSQYRSHDAIRLLKAIFNVVEVEEWPLDGTEELKEMLRAVETAPTHSEVRITGSSIKDWCPKYATLPPIGVFTGRHVLARAHRYAGARNIMGRVPGPEC